MFPATALSSGRWRGNEPQVRGELQVRGLGAGARNELRPGNV